MQQLHRIEDAEMTTARASCHQIATEMNINATSLCTMAHAMWSPPPLQTPGELDHLTFAGEHEDLLPFSLQVMAFFLPDFLHIFQSSLHPLKPTLFPASSNEISTDHFEYMNRTIVFLSESL